MLRFLSILLLLFLLPADDFLYVRSQSITYPPRPRSGFGWPPELVWGPAGVNATSAGLNPFNKLGANRDGSGGTNGCTNTLQTSYVMTVLENYQQLITFFPSTCNALKARILSLPA